MLPDRPEERDERLEDVLLRDELGPGTGAPDREERLGTWGKRGAGTRVPRLDRPSPPSMPPTPPRERLAMIVPTPISISSSPPPIGLLRRVERRL